MPVNPEEVISVADRLLAQYPKSFSGEFNRNREAVRNLANVNSIHLRNRIAGYITRQKQQ